MKKAALQNDLQSLKRAGVFYEHGVLGCNKDFLRATAYYVRAAIAGDATTQVYLGKSYENGALGMVSVQEAIRYYRMAAERGNQVARTRLEHLHKAAPVVASVMPGKSATVVGHSIPSGNQDSALVSQSTAAALFLGIRPSILAVPSTQEEAAHPAQASSGEEVSKRRAIIGVFLIGIAIAGGIAVSIFFPPSLLLIAIGAGLAYAVGLYAVNTSSWWQNFKKQNPPAAKWLARAGIAFGLIIAVACPLLLVLGKLAILSLPAFTISAAPVATVVVSGAVPFVVGGATAIIGAKEIGNINTQVHPGPPVFSNMSNVHSLGDHQVPSSSVAISIANNVSKTTALSAALSIKACNFACCSSARCFLFCFFFCLLQRYFSLLCNLLLFLFTFFFLLFFSSEYYDGLFVAADSKTFLQIKAEYASLFAGKCPNDRLANLLMARNLNFGQIEEDEKHVKEKRGGRTEKAS